MHALALIISTSLFAAPADKPASTPGAAPAMDYTKMGPASRKPRDEKAVRKEIDAFLKANDESAKKNDMDGMLALIDFPVYMVTDDAKGAVEAKAYTKDEYVAMMKPYFDNAPKDVSTQHKYSTTVLSDALAQVMDDSTMIIGKTKIPGTSVNLLVKRDGKWLWKTMVEAGWGGAQQQPAAPTPAPAK